LARLRLVLASQNEHKLRELRAARPDWELELLEARGYPPEDAGSYEGNAELKARFGRGVAPDEWVLGEDSGIEATALGGAPGIASARWAVDGVAALLAALEGEDDRRARYVCALVALGPDGREHRAVGTVDGTVATEPRGSEGFGYDPIFVPDGERRTVAELGDAWKREHSHRARAARALGV
jgi:XTP/dITP diphosphohydrolase